MIGETGERKSAVATPDGKSRKKKKNTMCILSVHTLLKVVGYYDLSVLSMSVLGFPKKFGWGGWVG